MVYECRSKSPRWSRGGRHGRGQLRGGLRSMFGQEGVNDLEGVAEGRVGYGWDCGHVGRVGVLLSIRQ